MPKSADQHEEIRQPEGWLAWYVPPVFLILAILFGSSYSFLTPPFQVPDEIGHFSRAVGVSSGHCLPDKLTAIPQGVWSMYTFFPPPLEQQAPDKRWVTRYDLFRWLKPQADQPRIPHENQAANLYTCAPYLPSALSIDVAELLRLPPLALLDLGRAVNLLVYVLLVYVALRVLPDFHLQLMFLALLPMTLSEAGSFSADALGFGSTLFLLAYILKLAFGANSAVLSRRELLILSGAVLCCSLMKFNIWLILFTALIPNSKLPHALRRWRLTLLMVTIAAAAALVWQIVNADNMRAFVEWKKTLGVDVSANASFLRHHPGVFVQDIGRSITSSGEDYLIWFVGCFGYLTTPLPFVTVLICVFCLILISVTQTKSVSLRGSQKALLFIIFLASFLSLFVLLFDFQTPAANLTQAAGMLTQPVGGIQGRYFIPFALPLLLCFSNRKLRLSARIGFGLTIATVCWANVSGIHLIWKQYYENAALRQYQWRSLRGPDGSVLVASDGRRVPAKLIRQPSTGAIFLMIGAVRHQIPDMKTLEANMKPGDQVYDLNDSLLLSIPAGPPVLSVVR